MPKIFGYRVDEHVYSPKLKRHRITVEFTRGFPIGSVFQRFEEGGWLMEQQPMPVNRYCDTVTYLVVFASIPNQEPELPVKE